ncbi:hypothetical protein [Burkholderia gladioli]|uniref:Uncharacterized protein n=1 Tax=Burkholderia gladioli (strain BSR3) TaxID=999541 RepID=F2LFN9_BURGS|nr:hypothetical protein [Burkholderia gladioli]AEA61673.1 hypothetical protein bgla_1g30630 [Burkholderia gladioli BSR3]
MKLIDLYAQARQQWLREEQNPRVIASEVARQSSFEKSTIVRVAVVAILLIVAADLAQEAPAEAQPTARPLTA